MEARLSELRPYPGEPRFGGGWRLAKAGWQLLRGDRTLVLLAVLLIAVVSVLFAVAALVGNVVLGPVARHGEIQVASLAYDTFLVLGSVYLLTAIAAAVNAAIDDAPMAFGEALAEARWRLPAIVGWSLLWVAAILALAILGQKLGHDRGFVLVPAMVLLYLATAWVLPAIAIDDLGPLEALRESLATLRQRWRQLLAGLLGLGFFAFLAMSPAYALLIHAAALHDEGASGSRAFAIAGLILVFAIGSILAATKEAFAVLLYRDALDDLPGLDYPGSSVRRRAKALRFVGALVGAVVVFAAFGALTKDDARMAAGKDYTTIAADVSGLPLPDGAPVIYQEREIGFVRDSGLEGTGLRVSFHLEKGFSPEATPGSFYVVARGGEPCLMLVPSQPSDSTSL